MSLVLLAATLAILGGVVVVAMGRGGEITLFSRDAPAVPFQLRTPCDVATLRLPLGLFGYQEHATGHALHVISRLLADRDAEIGRLRDEVRQLRLATSGGIDEPPGERSTAAGSAPSASPQSAGDQVRRAM